MGKFERTVVQVSVEDVIRILEDVPPTGHFIPYVTIAQMMNRVSIAHLAIEKAIKFLIQEAGGEIIFKHHLGDRFRELKEHDPDSADFLEDVFLAARLHYGIEQESQRMTHFRRLDTYLETTGSDDAFNKIIRYWELSPTLENALLRQVHLSIHMELVYGLHEILIEPDRPKETVENRVDRAVETAMSRGATLGYGQSPRTGGELGSYIRWIQECGSFREALSAAVRCDFTLWDNYASEITRAAYKSLLEAKDPAVAFFASTLDVLPRQPRDVVPEVEWLDPREQRKGQVKTAAGDTLGFIERGPHGLWYIRPLKSGSLGVSAKAKSQTDAQCYLAQLLARTAQLTVDGKTKTLRVVGEERHVFQPAPVQSNKLEQNHDEQKMYTALFWDQDHGLGVGQEIRIEVQRVETEGPTFSDALSGEVLEIRGHQVSVLGRSFTMNGSP